MLSKNKYKPSYDNSYLGCRQKFIARLNPNYNDKNKSYYGKARVIEWEDGAKALISYNTIVAIISSDDEFYKTWASWSATTAKHVNTFCDDYGFPTFNKAEWQELEPWCGNEQREFMLTHDTQYDRIPNRQLYGYWG